MKSKTLKLSQVKVNSNNPRSITERKLKSLIQSLLIFPKMLDIRPIVINDKFVALGGNMRLRALNEISKMSMAQLEEELSKTQGYSQKTEGEKITLREFWGAYLQNPTINVIDASNLSAKEKQQFVITDNASFGEWDYDKLANEWDADELCSWGVDVWRPDPALPTSSSNYTPNNNGESEFDPSNLPDELLEQDINPDELPKIEGDNQTLMERIIIVYPKERAEEVARMVGLEKIEKVVYNVKELLDGE